jgi:hypothetical protein
MGTQYSKLKDKDIAFIQKQHLFYIASSSGQEVNLSPKGYDSIRVLNPNQILYLDYPGSGNRTARDIENNGEITMVFNSFEENEAKILRIFSKGKIIKKSSPEFDEYLSKFELEKKFIRQFMLFQIYAVETSCGEAVPVMKFERRRNELEDWVKKMEKSGKLQKYIDDHETPPNLTNLT